MTQRNIKKITPKQRSTANEANDVQQEDEVLLLPFTEPESVSNEHVSNQKMKFSLFLAIALHLVLFATVFFYWLKSTMPMPGQNVPIVQASLVHYLPSQPKPSPPPIKIVPPTPPAIAPPKQILSPPPPPLPKAKPVPQEPAPPKEITPPKPVTPPKQADLAQPTLLTKPKPAKTVTPPKKQAQSVPKQLPSPTPPTTKVAKTTKATTQTKQQQQAATQKLQAAQQQLMQQQLAQDRQELASAAQSQQQQNEIDKYKAMVVQAISQNWLVPDNVAKGITCQLLIRVAPGGVVLSVQVIKSSGDPVLDRSATTAVFKSSPLPVPSDPTLFDKFRELRLTVHPEQAATS